MMQLVSKTIMGRLVLGLAVMVFGIVTLRAIQDEGKGDFGNLTIDLGTVVTDIEKSAKFYTEAIGFKEIAGFSVPPAFAAEAGLSDPKLTKPLNIRVFVLGDGPGATNETIHSQTGFRYLTLNITDTKKAVARLEKAGVKLLAKSPAAIPESIAKGIFLTVIKDPDGNIVELVGP